MGPQDRDRERAMMVEGQAETGIEPVLARPRRNGAPARGRTAAVAARRLLRYLPLVPSLFAFLVLLGYPVLLAVVISFQRMGLRELVQRMTVWIGLDNYASILADPTFWTVAIRTLAFTAFNVALTMI